MVSFYPIEDAHQKTVVALVILFTIFPGVAIGLRLWARRISGQRLKWSDGLILADYITLLMYWATLIIDLVSVAVFGSGAKRDDMSLAQLPYLEIMIYVWSSQLGYLLFGFAVYFLKLSALALFRELFANASNSAKTVLDMLTYLVVVCATAAITGSLYTLFPVTMEYPSSRDESNKMMINGQFNLVATVVLDFAIFFVPLWQVYGLRLQSRKKVGVMLAFGLGFV
ncbi:integral membrane protein [Apiospora arundinis]